MTDRIKLPWRRLGDERPQMGDTSPLLIVWHTELGYPLVAFCSDGPESLDWVVADGATTPVHLNDHWMYLEELEKPSGI